MPHADVRQYGEILIQQQRGVLVLRLLREQIVGQFELHQLEEEITEVMSMAEQAVVVDCQRVSGHASSEFLAMLIRLQRRLKAEGVALGVCGLTGPLSQAYRVCQFERVLPTFKTSSDAIRGLGVFPKKSVQRAEQARRRVAVADRVAWVGSLRDSIATGDPRVRLMLIGVAGLLVVWSLFGFVSIFLHGPRAGLHRRIERASRRDSVD